jgi:exosome complex component RRP46
MRYTFFSTIVAQLSKTVLHEHPTIKDIEMAKSFHVLTFSSKNELLLAESEGRFSMNDWELIERRAQAMCLGDADIMVEEEESKEGIQQQLRSVVEEKVRWNERWKNG